MFHEPPSRHARVRSRATQSMANRLHQVGAMSTTSQRFRAVHPGELRDEGAAEAAILPFPFPTDDQRRPRIALRPLTKPGLTTIDNEATARSERAGSRTESELDELGLGRPPRKDGLSRMFVGLYRLVGFAILTMIVIVLVSYLANAVFFYASSSWIAPVTVSSNDERVVSARTALLAQQDARDRTAGDLAQAERAIAAHRAFQAEFAAAIRADRDDRKAALTRLRALTKSTASVRSQLRATSATYARSFAQRIEQEHAAGLIDRNTLLTGKYQLGQISGANLALAERQAEYEARADELASEMRALESMIENDREGGVALSFDVLQIKRELEASRLDLAKALADRELLVTSLERQDKAIAAVESSPYLRATAEDATVAMVPYDNLEHVQAGAPVYACRLSFVLCREVGTVKEVLRGEVTFDHPRRDSNLRGQMVELELSEPDAVKQDVLFVGAKPLMF